jgi:hypothetical protein
MRLAMGNMFVKTFRQLTLSNYFGSCSERFITVSKLFKSNFNSLVSCRFTLEKGEVLRIPLVYRELHVLSGVAWITVAGEDIIVKSGEKTLLVSRNEFPVLSALGNVPLILEVL